MPRKLRIEYPGVIYHLLAFERRLEARRQAEAPEEEFNPIRLRQETTLKLNSIAARVGLRTSKSANARLHKWTRGTDLQAPHARRLKICKTNHSMV